MVERGVVDKAGLAPIRAWLPPSFGHHRNLARGAQKAKVRANSGRSLMPYTNAQARDLNVLFHPYTNLKLLE